MMSLRIVRAVRPAAFLATRLAAPSAVRGFAHTATAKASADLIRDIYVDALKNYQAPKAANEKVDLPTTFAAPAPPAKPEVDVTVAEVSATADEAVAEEEWPAVYNPIDDPANYPDEWDFTTENDDGKLLPARKYPVDYHSH
ncbi:hypothetical protein HDU89_007238 [Geranomyces variabilis]|nr:hypothetical protein BDZ88DRAFT_224331 [Geranomyces variabilis]KAJ3139572.1 hypothetical protein HDU90_009073 [Geranomyces variabilis]KAJ3155048.1 hypothetical protein HDU89_007238 [Geranomyces variabilis]